jgi:hypothetical protein
MPATKAIPRVSKVSMVYAVSFPKIP